MVAMQHKAEGAHRQEKKKQEEPAEPEVDRLLGAKPHSARIPMTGSYFACLG
jgi:hypothetical protein